MVDLSFLLLLTGMTGIHSITTVSKVSVKAGQSISIPCLYDSQYRNHVKYLCKGSSWSSCSYAVKTNQQSSGRFSISDDKSQRIFTVTIKDVNNEDTDYWCAVEVNGGFDDGQYFHLSVTEGVPSLSVEHQYVTANKGQNITISFNRHNSGVMKWCRLGGSCVMGLSGSIDGASVTIERSLNVVTMSGLRIENSGWYLCAEGDLQMPVHVTVHERPTMSQAPATDQGEQKRIPVDLMIYIIPLSVLIFTVLVTLFIWFMLKKHKQTKEKQRATATTPDAEMTSDLDVIYSPVVTAEAKPVQKKVEPEVEAVTYSTLAQDQ